MPKNYIVVNLKHAGRPVIRYSSTHVCQATAQGLSTCSYDVKYGSKVPCYQIWEMQANYSPRLSLSVCSVSAQQSE